MTKSSSLDHYYKRNVKVEGAEDADADPTVPELDGFLDSADRETNLDIGWNTPVSPKHGA